MCFAHYQKGEVAHERRIGKAETQAVCCGAQADRSNEVGEAHGIRRYPRAGGLSPSLSALRSVPLPGGRIRINEGHTEGVGQRRSANGYKQNARPETVRRAVNVK